VILLALTALRIFVAQDVAFAWPPATGPVFEYAVERSFDGVTWALVDTVAQPQAIVAIPWGIDTFVRVVALDVDGNAGPHSDASAAVATLPNADLNGDGAVGVTDFGLFRSAFGRCIAGTEYVPCAP